MDNISSPDESYDVGYGYQPSPSSVDDQSPTETTGLSTLSGNSLTYCRTNSKSSAFSEYTDANSWSEKGSPMSSWSLKSPTRAVLPKLGMRQHKTIADDSDTVDLVVEFELMKERFSKLLLGEDMSGGSKGVTTTVTTSNAITNLYASVFGQQQRLSLICM